MLRMLHPGMNHVKLGRKREHGPQSWWFSRGSGVDDLPLLDNITRDNREFADQRIAELKQELLEVNPRIEALERAAGVQVDLEQAVREMTGMLGSFAEVMQEGSVDERPTGSSTRRQTQHLGGTHTKAWRTSLQASLALCRALSFRR
jgi:hypothetical protein